MTYKSILWRGIFTIGLAFILYFYVLFSLRSLDQIDRVVLSSIGFIILLAIIIWQSSLMFKGRKSRPSYVVKGRWYNRGPYGKI